SGTIALEAGANYYYSSSYLDFQTSTKLTGGGKIELENVSGYYYSQSYIRGTASGGTIENVDNTNEGNGHIINYYPTTLVNDVAGTIDANVSGRTLEVGDSSFTNHGLAEATNGGILQIGQNIGYTSSSSIWTNAADGTISANNSTLVLTDRWTNLGLITATN